MHKKLAIIANGTITDDAFHKKILGNVDMIICADGGANHAYALGVIPEYIVGDFDSITAQVLSYFIEQKKTTLVKDTNPDKTDVELALSLAESLNPQEIVLLGALGCRMDHTLANMLCLTKLPSAIKAQIIDETNTIELVDKPVDITGKENDIVSVVPLTDVAGLSYKGMKWPVTNKKTTVGWFGISNRLLQNTATIALAKGKLLVIRVRKE
ncbi:MAG: thiamine diphosphokinase [Candidatus Thermoplasmatota archaeon]|nr:thiamine diphosphokinase [Candidatus Thermoplasmatota archaeon]